MKGKKGNSQLHNIPTKRLKPIKEENNVGCAHAGAPALLDAQHFNIHMKPGFSVRAISYSTSIKRLCVARNINPSGQHPDALMVVEFYNAINPPLIFLEKSVPVADSFETLAWIGPWAIFGGLGGRIVSLSPFTSKFGRFQMCTTDILVMVYTSNDQLIIGNNSSELLVSNKRESDEEECNKVPIFSIVQTLKLSSDDRITALASSKTLKTPMIAVGKVNGLCLFTFEKGKWRKNIETSIAHTKEQANIVWSLLFVDNFLFAGDAHGQLIIFNAENGSQLKSLKTHQAPILALATDGNEVFSAGTDYRIQVIKSIGTNKVRYDWQQCGQRLFHSNDVRAICILNEQWLVSGGNESELFVSNHFEYSNAQLRSECSVTNATSNLIIMVSRQLYHIDLWCKTNNSQVKRSAVKRLLRITSGKMGLIKHVCISPDGNFIAFSGTFSGSIRVLRLKSELIESLMLETSNVDENVEHLVDLYWDNQSLNASDGHIRGSRAVTAIFCTNNFLYIARGEFTMVRLNLVTKQQQILISKEKGSHIFKLCVDKEETSLVALTINGPFYLDLQNLSDSYHSNEIHHIVFDTMNSSSYECIFYGQYRILFLTSDLGQHVIFYDLRARKKLRTLRSLSLKFASNEWIAYIDANMNGQIVAMSNKGRIRLIIPTETSLHILTGDNYKQDELKEIAKGVDTRVEPFWCDRCETLQSCCLVLIKHAEENLPTQIPHRLRFYGKN